MFEADPASDFRGAFEAKDIDPDFVHDGKAGWWWNLDGRDIMTRVPIEELGPSYEERISQAFLAVSRPPAWQPLAQSVEDARTYLSTHRKPWPSVEKARWDRVSDWAAKDIPALPIYPAPDEFQFRPYDAAKKVQAYCRDWLALHPEAPPKKDLSELLWDRYSATADIKLLPSPSLEHEIQSLSVRLADAVKTKGTANERLAWASVIDGVAKAWTNDAWKVSGAPPSQSFLTSELRKLEVALNMLRIGVAQARESPIDYVLLANRAFGGADVPEKASLAYLADDVARTSLFDTEIPKAPHSVDLQIFRKTLSAVSPAEFWGKTYTPQQRAAYLLAVKRYGAAVETAAIDDLEVADSKIEALRGAVDMWRQSLTKPPVKLAAVPNKGATFALQIRW